jgi:hypothetical protein
MRHLLSVCPLVVTAGLLLAAPAPPLAHAQAEGAPPSVAGNWKVTFLYKVQEVTFFLINLEVKGGKVKGSVLATSSEVKGTTIKNVAADASSLRFVLEPRDDALPFVFYFPRGKDKIEALRGSVWFDGQYRPATLRATKEKGLKEDAAKPVEGFEEMREAFGKEEKERDRALEALLKKHAGKPITLELTAAVIQLKLKGKAKAEEVKPLAEQHVRFAARYGREAELDANFRMAQQLGSSKSTAALGLEHGRKAIGLLRETDNARHAVGLLETVSKALKKAGKADEAKTVQARVSKFQDRANQEAVEEVRAALKGLDAGADPKQRLFLLKELAARLKKAGKADEVKGALDQVAKLRKSLAREALDDAQKRVKALGEKGSPAARESAFKALATALRRNGKPAEAKEYDAKAAQLRDRLDKEQIKRGLPFKTEAFAGRKGKSDRAVLVELFTGAQCPPCIAADLAFDGLLRTYKPSEVVLLQYHLHVPRPDPLSNADTVARAVDYGFEGMATPTLFLDGKEMRGLGGFAPDAVNSYETLRDDINKQLEVPAQAKVKLSVSRKGDKLSLTATASVTGKAANPKLRLALVEDEVSYVGGNGLRLHHHVVRAMPGGEAGTKVGAAEVKVEHEVDLGALRKSLRAYLTNYEEEEDEFPSDYWPMDLKHLKVVAFVQDDDTRQVLQAVQMNVPAGAKE